MQVQVPLSAAENCSTRMPTRAAERPRRLAVRDPSQPSQRKVPMMLKSMSLIAITLAASTSFGQAQDVAPSCQDQILVERGDTLSAIAERCDISEARILAANPRLEGSSDLVIGQVLATQSVGKQVGDNLWGSFKGAVGQTGDALEGVAKGVNSSAQEILDRNPNLRSGIDSLGATLTGRASGRVTLKLLPATPEADVEITATDLPANQAVRLNVGAVGAASESVREARTSADGTLTESIVLPGWLPAQKQVVVTITDEQQNVVARSPRFSRE